MFNDQKIEKGRSIGRELLQAIRESIVSVVVFSKNYASSSWCLDELVEIFKCRKAFGQFVLPIFYDVDPSDVRKQMGDFEKAFKKSCEGKTEEVKQEWTEALAYVANIAGEHSKIWVNEAEIIQKIATDVAKILEVTPSIDFEGMVYDIGNIKEQLQNQKVLIILDDVEELEALDKDLSWFGSGSRIIVTSEDETILKANEIQVIYHVGFPSKKEAVEILCLSAFKQSSVPDGFEELAKKVAKFCGNLPLGLCVVGSSLRGESKEEWELQISRIKDTLGRMGILRVGYDRLLKKHQSLFLHIACVFNDETARNVISVLYDSNLDVENGLMTLVDRSLLYISMNGKITMHQLLQQLGRQIVLEQSERQEERQFLVEAKEIRDVLTNKTGTYKSLSVMGITFSSDKRSHLSEKAFEGMPNLQFLRIYCDKEINFVTAKGQLHVPRSMTYLPRLRSLHWNLYPRKNLPPRFQTEHLVELHLPNSHLKKLWDEIKSLPNLKTLDMNWSERLKEIPNLS